MIVSSVSVPLVGLVGTGVLGNLDDAIYLENRIPVSRGAGSLEAPALIYRNIHEHRAGLHQPQLLTLDYKRCAGTMHKHRADHQVSLRQELFHGK